MAILITDYAGMIFVNALDGANGAQDVKDFAYCWVI